MADEQSLAREDTRKKVGFELRTSKFELRSLTIEYPANGSFFRNHKTHAVFYQRRHSPDKAGSFASLSVIGESDTCGQATKGVR